MNSSHGLLRTRVAEAAGAAGGGRQRLGEDEARAGAGGDHELGDPVAAGDGDRLRAEVDGDDGDLATVVGVDRTGGVEKGQAVAQGEAAAGADLALVTGRDRDREAGGDEGAGVGPEDDRRGDAGAEVQAGAAGGGGLRQGEIGVAGGAGDRDGDQGPLRTRGRTGPWPPWRPARGSPGCSGRSRTVRGTGRGAPPS